MSEDDLLARFAALRAPQTPLGDLPLSTAQQSGSVEEQARKKQEEDEEIERIANGMPNTSLLESNADRGDGDEELVKRVARLKGSIETSVDGDDDADVETFLKNLKPGPPENDLEDESDEKIIARAFAQARTKRRNLATSEEGEEDGPTEEEILAQALDEARLEHSSSPTYPGDNTDEIPEVAFPSLPSHAPQEADTDDGVDEETRQKLNLLLGLASPTKQGPTLPSAPKNLPSIRKYDLPGYDSTRDEAVDTWCCICNRDASLQCLGCDDDLYCEECWKEGHGAGGDQEKGHKVKRFAWGGRHPLAT
ncbi:hypothetical protein C351_06747 [Cryptococcus neoformans c8]|nr:hypothetical protein C353_06718 [Cryptococcus neoformans var. grubii AD1-83a]OXG45855.1 hypothetical protein C354_06702 [Cryptococcus neoformans var. grubii MW-RSA1955]OXG49429.1 hypothetical protein C352_06720 [Cryptococcus neoformans var. grubii CHC193]OXG56707.1 hypothetical protein C351_06747 [Cryptococcus neoformans var. grubii c8]OXH01432.1 hypothetical protein C369_06835 [Cryptococcus neoformans var. grubii A5-35-17]OXH02709.1 hypothetical protein C370_06897 [Cryptococcus neoformans 